LKYPLISQKYPGELVQTPPAGHLYNPIVLVVDENMRAITEWRASAANSEALQ
jgi:hypothetical protein